MNIETTPTAIKNHATPKYVECPQPFYHEYPQGTYSGDFVGVWCAEDEEVEWHWCDGRVTGFSVWPISFNLITREE